QDPVQFRSPGYPRRNPCFRAAIRAQTLRLQFAVAGERRGVQPRGFRSFRQRTPPAGFAADQCGTARPRGRGREGEGALAGEVRLGALINLKVTVAASPDADQALTVTFPTRTGCAMSRPDGCRLT